MLITGSIWVDVLAIVVALVAGVITYIKWTYTYWQRKGYPYLEAKSMFGSIDPGNRKVAFGDQMRQMYEQVRARDLKYCGFYTLGSPQLLVADLDHLKNIMAKDFSYFVDRGNYYNEKDEPMGAHLFSVGGAKWRNLRTKLTPTFTSGKIKTMFQTLVECIDPMLKAIDKEAGPIDIKDIAGRFTTDIIGSCAFGLDFNTFEDPNSPFRVHGIKAFTVDKKRAIKSTFTSNYPNLSRALHLKKIPTEITEFFTKLVEDTVGYRQKTGKTRKDFLQLLIDLMGKGDGQFNMDEVVAQSFVFFLAGFETSSTTMTFTLYELSKHQDIQDKLREEITRVLSKHDQKFTYDSINEMKYLTQVVEESLRMHPPAPAVSRQCVKDYNIPGTQHVIEKGTKVLIPIYGIQMDPEHYPEPEKFDPERFSDENKHDRHQFSFLPFGEGNRICIGMRFGMMQTKVGLAALIKNYRLTLNPKTVQPLRMATDSIVLSTEGGVWLNAEKLH